MFGRDRRFDIETTAAFRRDAASIEPTLILVGGLLIDLTLMVMFTMLSRVSRRALSFADLASAKLRRRTAALEESNGLLESFAYVVSHDLKAPLNGIDHLAEFIEDDLESIATDEHALPEVSKNVDRIRKQVRRSRALIDGILDYSGIGHAEEPPTRVDTRGLVEDIGESLGVAPEQLVLEGDLPVLLTQETRLSQVLSNLVGNAFKYHHDRANARVVVRTEEAGTFHHFSIQDDGPGVAPAHHERVFKLFQTLGSNKAIGSTGVGLSIVQKTVEGLGGTVSVESRLGHGATFTFKWPMQTHETDEALETAQIVSLAGQHADPRPSSATADPETSLPRAA